MLGNAIVVNCQAEGYPEPEISWFKGGKYKALKKIFCLQAYARKKGVNRKLILFVHFDLVRGCEDGKTSKEFKLIASRNSSLAVDFATDADEGYYMCQANNGIGPDLKKVFHINVNGK